MENHDLLKVARLTRVTHRGLNAITGEQLFDNSRDEPYATSRDVVVKFSQGGDRKSPTPFYFDVSETIFPAGYRLDRSQTTYGDYVEFGLSGVQPNLSPSNTRLDAPENTVRNNALSDFYGRLKSGELDLGSDLSEAASASRRASQHLDSANRILGRTHRVREKPPRGLPIRALKHGGRAWLAWQYAIWPAVQSAYTAASFILRDDPVVSVASGQSAWRDTRKSSSRGGFNERILVQQTDTRFFGKKFTALFRVEDPSLYNLARITSLNPALWAWNTVTLSFVVDWFADVGGYMELLEASLGMGLSAWSIAERTLDIEEYHTSWVGTDNQFVDGQKPPSTLFATTSLDAWCSSTRKRFSRDILLDLPRPVYPTVKVELGSHRLLSAASLLSTLLKR